MFMGKLGHRRTRSVPPYQRERGAALVEFALVASLLVLLVLGIVEFGWKFGQFNDVRHGAREGARFAAVDAGNNSDIRAHVCNSMDALSAGITEVRIDLDEGSGAKGGIGAIRVEADVSSLSSAPFISSFLPTELVSDVEFRLEQDADNWNTEGLTVSC